MSCSGNLKRGSEDIQKGLEKLFDVLELAKDLRAHGFYASVEEAPDGVPVLMVEKIQESSVQNWKKRFRRRRF